MPSVSFVLYIVTNHHWRSQNKPQGKKLEKKKKERKLEAPEKEYTFFFIIIIITVSLYRFVEMIGSKVTSVVIYKASCHKIVKFYFFIYLFFKKRSMVKML